VAHSVFYVDLGIELNLTLPDLGHPDRPGLWEQLKTMKYQSGRLQCPLCRDRDPECPEWMYLQERAGGRRVAVHHNPRIRDHHARESNLHKALKERIASAAQGGGFAVEFEDQANHGRRRTDVLVRAADGFLLGCEAQVSYATAAAVRKRTEIANRDGITSLWTTNDRKAQLINQAPWARIDRMPWHDIANGAELPVRGGIRALHLERCEDRPTRCPDRKRGRCRNWHASWVPQAMRLDDLIVRAAGQEYQPVHIATSRGGGHWFWTAAADKATYLENLAERTIDDDETRSGGTPAVTPRPLSRVCTYGVDTGVRADASPVRDTGTIIDAPTITLDQLGTVTPIAPARRTISSRPGPHLWDPAVPEAALAPEMIAWSTRISSATGSCGHIWPGELDLDCFCQVCGLLYQEHADWS
jgi:hypothetical protein